MSFTAGAGTRFVVTSTASQSSGTVLTGPITATAGTATADTPAFNITQTWNNAAVTFTGLRFNVTDTASNANSLLMDLQRGGTGQFSVNKNGHIAVNRIYGYSGANVYSSEGIELQTQSFNLSRFTSENPGLSYVYALYRLNLSASSTLNWTSSNSLAAPDLTLARDAANTLAQRNSTNAQTFNLYNTFTDASNYERGGFSWVSNELQIRTQAVGTGVGRSIYLNSAANIFIASASAGEIRFFNAAAVSWLINGSSHLFAGADNTYDIGASGANRPRTVFAATSVLAPYVRTSTAYTVATLPAAGTAGAGARAFVTDATVTTFASIVAGGGANAVPVVSNGTNWIIG